MTPHTYSFLPLDVGFDLRWSGDYIDLPREEPLQVTYLEEVTPMNFMGTWSKAVALLQLAGYRINVRAGLEEARVQVATCSEKLARAQMQRDRERLEYLSVMFARFAEQVNGALWKSDAREEALTLATALEDLSDQAWAAYKEL